MIGRDRMGDVLQQNSLAGARWRDDQSALAFAKRCDQIDHAGGKILLGRIVGFHPQPLIGIERRQIIKVRLVLDLFRVFEIDRIDLEQRENNARLPLVADRSLNRIAGLQLKRRICEGEMYMSSGPGR